MRLFVAVALDPATRAAVAGTIDRARRRRVFGTGCVRWIAPRNLHLTLQFLGETSADTAAAVVEALAAAGGRPPFRAALGPAGLFPAHGPPRVLWLGIGDGSAELAALRQAVGKHLLPLGYPSDDRPYRAHLTVGRLRPGRGAGRRALEAGLAEIAPPPAAWLVDRIVLMESRLSSAGAAYRTLSEVPLGGAPRPAAEARESTC